MSIETQVLQSHLSGSDSGGLSNLEAQKRLEANGPNSVTEISESYLSSLIAKFWSPIPWMLEVVIVIQLALRDYVEASVILLLLVFNAGLSFFQESRAQATLEALKSRLALNANVRRDSLWKVIPAAQLVRGDEIKLSLGGVVPADVLITQGSVLLDQSMITGESVPVEAGPSFQAYAGALVRRGEAVGKVTRTGAETKFGKSAELIRAAHVESSQQKVVFRVVRNLAIFNSVIILCLIAYAVSHSMAFSEIIGLILTAVLTSIPVALPATFTLSEAIGAKSLAKGGVLPTRLSAIEEAASMEILCVDKTGTLTENALSVTAVVGFEAFDEDHVLMLAALASSDGGQDSVDVAIRRKAAEKKIENAPTVRKFIAFDPHSKMSKAIAKQPDGSEVQIVKGAFSVVAALCLPDESAFQKSKELEAKGYRVLAVAVGVEKSMRLTGLIALSDPPRKDSADLVAKLLNLGVRVIMVTGDAPATASIVAKAVGITGPIFQQGVLPESLKVDSYAVFAGVLPEDKYKIVQEFQSNKNTVGMCGDGANDAPALRQAQIGIAVMSATDVAKSAAGIVLTRAGLGGIVAAVVEGRTIFQRLLTYTLKSVAHKFVGALFLFIGLIMTGQAVLTPLLLVISMITGDFLSMLSSTDRVRPSVAPSMWRVNSLTFAGIALGFCVLIFCISTVAFAKYHLGFDIGHIQTLSVMTLIFSGQALLYCVRERRHFWSSRPSRWLMVSSILDIMIISSLAATGTFMKALPVSNIAILLGATLIFGIFLDLIKFQIFRILKIC